MTPHHREIQRAGLSGRAQPCKRPNTSPVPLKVPQLGRFDAGDPQSAPTGCAAIRALVTSDAHAGLIGATLPGASWQRCRAHYAASLIALTPKSSWGWVNALLHSVFDQPDAQAVHA